MGCAQSKVDNEESVVRCKERKILMKEAVAARNAFAAGHSGYAVSLKNIGAALSDYAHGEAEDSHLQPPPLDATSQPPPPLPLPPPPPPSHSLENLPLPPPPLPNFSPSPIKRAMSMPALPMKQLRKARQEMDSVAIEEGEEEEEDEEEDERELDHGARNGNKNNGKDDISGPRGPQNGKVGPEEGNPRSPPRTPENHSVPPMPEAKNMAWDYFFMVENVPGPSLEAEDDHNHIDHDHHNTNGKNSTFEIPSRGEVDEVEPRTLEKEEEEEVAAAVAVEEGEEEEGRNGKQIEHSKAAPAEFMLVSGKKGVSVPSVNLMQVLNEIDDNFLRASENAQEVSRMLEATRLHYHSTFADNRGRKFNNS